MPSKLWAACACALLVAVRAQAGAASPRCTGPLRAPAEIAACAVSQSLEVQVARKALQTLAAQRQSAVVVLPSHPLLAVSLASRQPPAAPGAAGSFLNWYVTLSQELEIAGQRGARLDVVDAEAAAQVRRVAGAEQEAAAGALLSYYQLLAAREELRLAALLGGLADALSRQAGARAALSLSAPVDADVAAAEATRLGLVRIEAEQHERSARLALLTRLGLDPLAGTEITGTWPPELPAEGGDALDEAAQIDRALLLRSEVAAAGSERAARQQQVRLARRARVPNVTVSLYAQSDGLGEQVLGGGVAVPLFLPSPLGPSRRGELLEAAARAEQAELAVEQVRRRVRLEVAQAVAAERAQAAAAALFSLAQVERAEADLQALGQAVLNQKLPLREALLSQRSLIELLQACVRVRLAVALSRVERLRATGSLLPEGMR